MSRGCNCGAGGCISIDRILGKLDEHLNKNDYSAAEKHLLYWLGEAEAGGDHRTELLMRNELMGLYRKLGKEEEALRSVSIALNRIEELNISEQVGSATTFLNCATVYKAFGGAEKSIPLFERARAIYEKELNPNDSRLGGLFNNMGLALVDLGRFSEAKELYGKAIAVMESQEDGDLEVAITYLNIASALEAELGLADADEEIQGFMDKSESILESHENKDGYYAFVCEKCASVFGYYGRFIYEDQLTQRAEAIYRNARS